MTCMGLVFFNILRISQLKQNNGSQTQNNIIEANGIDIHPIQLFKRFLTYILFASTYETFRVVNKKFHRGKYYYGSTRNMMKE